MADDNGLPEGYKEKSLQYFSKYGIKSWSEVIIRKGGTEYRGVVLPRNKFAEDGYIEIKLKNGYNIGIRITEDTEVKVVGQHPPMKVSFEKMEVPSTPGKPNVTLVGTGGTIASRLDYTTGGVIPAFEPYELFAAVPELAEICNLDTQIVFKIFSEDMHPRHWTAMAEKVAEIANSGVDGIIVAHGTDTMGYSTAALSFMLKNLKVPVVFVGSQRSSDRPSSDAALNLINAATLAARGDLAEVVLCMLGSSSHTYGLIHRGTLVRKMHSSVRHTFRTIGDIPLGAIYNGDIVFFKDVKKKSKVDPSVTTYAESKIEEKVALVYVHPGINPELIEFYIDKGYKGLVFAGTGLGHTPHTLFPAIKRAHEEGIIMVMTVQTLWGFTGMNVYETGRELQSLGVIPGANMLPETAFVKLCWLLGNYSDPEEIKKLITENIAGEILPGEPPNGYPIKQGVEERIEKIFGING